jgi:hypothetical protein
MGLRLAATFSRVPILEGRMRWCCLLLLLAVAVGPPALPAGEADVEPFEAVHIVLSVEQALMAANLNEYQKLILRRDETAARLSSLQEALDAAVGDEKSAESGRLDLLIDQVARVAGERDALFASERSLLDRISDRSKRIQLLTRRVAELEGRETESAEQGMLTGTWDLILMPVDQRGTAKLRQDGAILSGTYTLAGGWSGSLQGTLVNRKVFLVRTDSKLGRMMEFEGYLSRDDQRIRGTWLNYEVSGAEGGTGQWTAERRLAED